MYPLGVWSMPCEAVVDVHTWGYKLCLARQCMMYPLGVWSMLCEAVRDVLGVTKYALRGSERYTHLGLQSTPCEAINDGTNWVV